MISCCDLQLRAWQRINPNSDFQWFSCCGFAPRLSVSHLVQQLASNYAVALVWDSDSGGTACLCWSIFGQKIEPKEQLVKKSGGVFEESLPVTMYYECSIADMHKQPSVPKGLLNQNVLSQRERERETNVHAWLLGANDNVCPYDLNPFSWFVAIRVRRLLCH